MTEKDYHREGWLRQKYRFDNLGPTDMAEESEHDVSPGAISHWISRYNIQKRHRDEDWLHEKYVEENLTSVEIAEICDVSQQSVLNNLEKVGIDRPDKSEMWDMYEAPLEGVTGDDHPMGGIPSSEHPMWGITGKDHPTYKNGSSYNPWRDSSNWRKAREFALEHDNHECQICSSGDDLHVHHIVPVSEGGRKFALENLIALCESCHMEVHSDYYSKNDSSEAAEQESWITQEEAAYK